MLEQLATIVCDTQPERMGGDAELFTDESWTCQFGAERVRMDFYDSDAQAANALEVMLEFFASIGDDREASEFPLVCGPTWSIGVDFNDTRDVLIGELAAAGIEASRC